MCELNRENSFKLISEYFNSFAFDKTSNTIQQIMSTEWNHSNFSTQVIFEPCDFDAAIAELFLYGKVNSTSPWKIRNVFVQESLSERFKGQANAKRIGVSESNSSDQLEVDVGYATKLGADIIRFDGGIFICDVERSHLPTSEAIFVNYFRTPKECVSLLNQTKREHVGRFASVWTENISLAHEIVGKLNFNNFSLNSIGFNYDTEKLFGEWESTDKDSNQSWTIYTDKYNAQSFVDGQLKIRKNILIPFGTIFAN